MGLKTLLLFELTLLCPAVVLLRWLLRLGCVQWNESLEESTRKTSTEKKLIFGYLHLWHSITITVTFKKRFRLLSFCCKVKITFVALHNITFLHDRVTIRKVDPIFECKLSTARSHINLTLGFWLRAWLKVPRVQKEQLRQFLNHNFNLKYT